MLYSVSHLIELLEDLPALFEAESLGDGIAPRTFEDDFSEAAGRENVMDGWLLLRLDTCFERLRAVPRPHD